MGIDKEARGSMKQVPTTNREGKENQQVLGFVQLEAVSSIFPNAGFRGLLYN